MSRTLFAVGSSEPRDRDPEDFARRCAWCGKWAGDDDAVKASRGALISHGICPKCSLDIEHPELPRGIR